MNNPKLSQKRVRKPTGIVGKDEKYENSKYFMDNGIDLEKRTVSIYDSIDNDVASYVVRGLRKMLEVDPDADIDVEIASVGGDVYYGLAIFDAIRQCPCTVKTHAQGPVMSAALIIYLAGDQRYASDNVTFMAHSASSRTWGKEFEQTIDIEELKRLNRLMCEILSNNTKMSMNQWLRKIRTHDYYFTYETAKDLEVITHEYEMEEE